MGISFGIGTKNLVPAGFYWERWRLYSWCMDHFTESFHINVKSEYTSYWKYLKRSLSGLFMVIIVKQKINQKSVKMEDYTLVHQGVKENRQIK